MHWFQQEHRMQWINGVITLQKVKSPVSQAWLHRYAQGILVFFTFPGYVSIQVPSWSFPLPFQSKLFSPCRKL